MTAYTVIASTATVPRRYGASCGTRTAVQPLAARSSTSSGTSTTVTGGGAAIDPLIVTKPSVWVST